MQQGRYPQPGCWARRASQEIWLQNPVPPPNRNPHVRRVVSYICPPDSSRITGHPEVRDQRQSITPGKRRSMKLGPYRTSYLVDGRGCYADTPLREAPSRSEQIVGHSDKAAVLPFGTADFRAFADWPCLRRNLCFVFSESARAA
jgi:hypothetical protein